MSLFEIKCPLCKGNLWIDPASGKVVDARAHDQQKASFDEFLKAQKQKSSEWDEKLKKAQEEEAKRKAELEKKFREAKEGKLDENIPPIQSPINWD